MSTSDKKEEIDQTLTDIYYQPTHLWKGNKAIYSSLTEYFITRSKKL